MFELNRGLHKTSNQFFYTLFLRFAQQQQGRTTRLGTKLHGKIKETTRHTITQNRQIKIAARCTLAAVIYRNGPGGGFVPEVSSAIYDAPLTAGCCGDGDCIGWTNPEKPYDAGAVTGGEGCGKPPLVAAYECVGC